jgi:hypothetical protein
LGRWSGHGGEDNVLSLVAFAAAAVAAESPSLTASAPWWDKVTMTIDGNGAEQACSYESSLSPQERESCTDEPSPTAKKAKGPAGLFTKLTFERRFSPGSRPEPGRLQPGDMLVGRQVIYLTIDGEGSVQGCKVIDVSGEVPDYGCKEAQTEKFDVRLKPASAATQQAFMTILVYGHTEQVA